MIGVDLVNISEFEQQIHLGGKAFLKKAFAASELQDQRVHHLAGLWAAKEAVIKAAGATPQKMTEIIIVFDSSGRPHGKFGPEEFEISIAHHGGYAISVACIIKE